MLASDALLAALILLIIPSVILHLTPSPRTYIMLLKYPAQPQRVEGGEDVQMTPCTLDRYGSSVYVPEQHDVGARRWSEV